MRNRIRKHCNTIKAKGGELNNKFKHSLASNRLEVLLHHAQVDPNNSYQGGIQELNNAIVGKKYQQLKPIQ